MPSWVDREIGRRCLRWQGTPVVLERRCCCRCGGVGCCCRCGGVGLLIVRAGRRSCRLTDRGVAWHIRIHNSEDVAKRGRRTVQTWQLTSASFVRTRVLFRTVCTVISVGLHKNGQTNCRAFPLVGLFHSIFQRKLSEFFDFFRPFTLLIQWSRQYPSDM